MSYEYGWIPIKPTKRERFIRWILRQPKFEFDYTLTFPIKREELKEGTRIRTQRSKR